MLTIGVDGDGAKGRMTVGVGTRWMEEAVGVGVETVGMAGAGQPGDGGGDKRDGGCVDE